MTGRTAGQPVPRLELRQVVVSGDVPRDLALAAGDLVAITGWDSSPLLWVAAGLDGRIAGEVLVDGHPIEDHEEALASGTSRGPGGVNLGCAE